jgi:toxin ParE1/3/4
MSHIVRFDVAAQSDLSEIYDYIELRAGDAVASEYIEKLMAYCSNFTLFPERGIRRDDLGPGLRVVGYERKATIAFRVQGKVVTIIRILHKGRSFGLSEADDE